MDITIALAGNPNSGKSTLFNMLTGSNQYVGNWPGVTVEKKEGKYTKDKNTKITDLPGIYSLSPYTLEEVVSRDYLLEEKPDVIIDVVDASNMERNLYLSTQLSELGIPMVIALNMMDIVEKNNDKIDVEKLKEELGCEIIEISALKNKNIDKLIEVAKKEVLKRETIKPMEHFDEKLEKILVEIEEKIDYVKNSDFVRWTAIKLVEEDVKVKKDANLTKADEQLLQEKKQYIKEQWDDDGEGTIISARYDYITKVTSKTVVHGRKGHKTTDKIDEVVTNRFLAIPIFIAIMFMVYYISIMVVGGPITEWVNGELIGTIIQGNSRTFLEGVNVAPWLISLIVDGIIGGVGSVLGFLPQIAVLFFLLSILEDVGYMSRVAFILDKVFRKFGLSGKSFIPILVGTGCSVPGISATRTIENESDRKLTIIVASFMPCSAKTEVIALFAGSIFMGKWWFAPICYFIGITSVAVSGLILKKFMIFRSTPAPFVMELPEYHTPMGKNVFKSTWDRVRGFIIKAGTVILLATVIIWLLQNISVKGEFHAFSSDATDSVLAAIGKVFAPIFVPLGFGNWIATVASGLGLFAKEIIVGTLGVLSGSANGAKDPNALKFVGTMFTSVSALSFMIFNQLNIPCIAAVGAMKQELNSWKWLGFAVLYQSIFSYCVAMVIYQFGAVLVLDQSIGTGFIVSVGIVLIMLYLIVKKPRKINEQ